MMPNSRLVLGVLPTAALLLVAAGLVQAQEQVRLRPVSTIYLDSGDDSIRKPEGVAYNGKDRLVAADTGNGRLVSYAVGADEVVPISEIVLVAMGSMTHSYDMNQRVVELPVIYSGDYGEHSFQITRAPLDAATAPPGNYMLFALDENRVPSIAKIVTLTR